jgi:uncharacterized sulfatase
MKPIRRRELLGSIAGAAAALGLPPRCPGAGEKRPNLILVLMDDLGYGQFGPNSDMFDLNQLNPVAVERAGSAAGPAVALAQAKAAIPNLSRLAAEGTRFTDAYVACPLCAPSRTAILTGRYPQRFGIYVNEDINQAGVPREQLLLPKLLQKSGYATAAIGKWHLANLRTGMDPGTGQHPLDRGFDYFFGFNAPGTSYYESEILWRNREPAPAKGYTTEQFTDEAIGFIRRSKGKPFFLYLPFNAVHGPLGRPAPDKYQQRFTTGDKRMDNFYAYLNAADEGVGRIRQVLEEQGEEKNTMIFVLSDNGAPGGSPLPSNGPFLGFKGQVWQGGLRIPMLAWGAGRVAAGQVCREPVISMDILPTALAAAGVEAPGGNAIDGTSLLPLLRGERQRPHAALFWAGQLSQRWAGGKGDRDEPAAWAVRKGRWMLRYWSHLKRYELYDLDADRGERRDISAAHPETVRELKAEYAAWFKGIVKPLGWD